MACNYRFVLEQQTSFYKNDSNHIKNLNFQFFYLALLLITHGDIETNPRPKSKNSKYVSCCHWNVTVFLHMINYLY